MEFDINYNINFIFTAVKLDKSEQTDITTEEYELDDCLLESNDIVITQNKDGFVLHVKKLGGNITTAKLGTNDEEEVAVAAVAAATSGSLSTHQQHQTILTPLTTSQTIKLPSSECELINLKKMIPAATTIATHHAHTAIIHQEQHAQQHQQQIHATIEQQQQTHHQSHHHVTQVQQQQQHLQDEQNDSPLVQSIVTTASSATTCSTGTTIPQQTINLLGLRNVQITETSKTSTPLISRIKYSRGKIITTQGSSTNVQIIETQDSQSDSTAIDLGEGSKYEISEIDLNNATASAAMISDLVKYAEIDDIELPDGTKIGIGFAPTELTEQQLQAAGANTSSIKVEHPLSLQEQQQQQQPHQLQHQHHHHQHQHQHLHLQEVSNASSSSLTTQQLQQLHEHDEATTSVEECILPDNIELQEQPLTKSYTILTTRPIKQDLSGGNGSNSSLLASAESISAGIVHDEGESNTTTYELSLSDSSLQPDDTKYVCRHCGKKYRWKSTLRRHENVECGGKEPCHPCPHCSYKAKQRGNLGVHVRKHHPDKPQLESKRGRKI